YILPAPKANILGWEDTVYRKDRIAFTAGRAGIGEAGIVDVRGERSDADFHAGIQDAGRVQSSLHAHEQVVELLAEHAPDELGAHPAVPMFPADRAAKPREDCLMNLPVSLHHPGKVFRVVHVE